MATASNGPAKSTDALAETVVPGGTGDATLKTQIVTPASAEPAAPANPNLPERNGSATSK